MAEMSKKKLFVLYLLSMPLIACLFVYYGMRQDTVGLVAENAGAIWLFFLVYLYLRAILERRK